MNMDILHGIEGAKAAKGLTVVIDVFRAFSLACYVMGNGADKMIPVGDLETAYQLKKRWSDSILIGERGGVIQPGFDYGNSPAAVLNVNFHGKTVVHTTSAGTQGIVNAVQSDEIVTGSFVNVGAIIRYIQQRRPQNVSLVAMGWGGEEPADEDTLCAEYIRDGLLQRQVDFERIRHFLRYDSQTYSFMRLDGEASAPKEDFDLCLSLDRFSFVLSAQKDEQIGQFVLHRIDA
ncbi:2-phosphosulfolactate phosphatase [Marinicrinis lubricantis]|uniref:Probable 2-phosphosulfolactate phosphatase n=1 Tax=Marinicrinis lubricantis TaxID=2086470 RepID=A0ABW1ITR1_9BACL